MKVDVVYRGKKLTLEFDKEKVKVKDILKHLNLSRDYAFVVKDGEILDENEYIKDDEVVRVVNAISGG